MLSNTRLLLLCLATLGLTAFAGCDEGDRGGKLNVFIVEANPERGHAPLPVTFGVDFSDDGQTEYAIAWDFGDGATLANQRNPNHTYPQPGTYTAKVTVTDTATGASGTDERVIEVLPSADLEVSGLQVAPLQITAGQTLSVQYNLRNQANAVETPFTNMVFLTTNAAADAGDIDEFIILQRSDVQSLPAQGEPGSTLDEDTEARIPESVPSGDYFVGVLADADAGVGELDETNNIMLTNNPIAIRNPRTDGPDLLPTNVSANPKRTRILSSVTIDFTVENRGVSSALLFRYAIFLSPDEVFDPDMDTFLLVGNIPGVTAGGNLRVEDVLVPINPAIQDPGDYHFFVVIDPEDELVELDESNNTAKSATPVSVTDEPILDADIVVEDFTLDPASTFLGGSVLASIKLYNQGKQPTGSFICTLYLSQDQVLDSDEDEVLTSINIFELTGETRQTVEQIITIPTFFRPGDYWPFIFCDAAPGVVVEFDENNNIQRFTRQLSIAVTAEVDLEPRDVRIDPASPIQNGDTVNLRFDACNNGSTGSSPTLLRVFLDQTLDPTPENRILFESVLPGIEPGTCQPFEADIEVNCTPWVGNYQLVVQFDGRELLDETDEDNNTEHLEGGLAIQGATCSCVNETGEPNNFSSVPFPLVVGQNTGLALCSGDSDWYSVFLEASDSLIVTLESDPALGKLDLLLYDPSKKLLETSAGHTGAERVDTFLVPFAGDYLLQVVPHEPGGINTYTLDVDVRPPTSGQPDLAAVDLDPSVRGPELGVPFDLSMALVNLSDTPVASPVRVSIYLSEDTTIDPGTDTELDSFDVPSIAALERNEIVRSITIPGETASGEWRVGAIADALEAVAEADETNNSSVTPPLIIDAACFDILEPNDTLGRAAEIIPQDTEPTTLPNYENLVVCKVNPDVYRVRALNGKRLRFTVDSDASLGDLDIVLRAADGSELTASRTTNDTEEVILPVTVGDQDLFLEVIQHPSQFNSPSSTYSLTVTMVDADPQLVCNAVFEPNDTFDSATGLLDAAAQGGDLATCPKTDDDFYKINLTSGTFIEIALNTTSRNLRASLYDPNRNFVQTLFNPSTETLSYTAPTSGTYFVKVFAGAGAARQETYTLDVTGLDGVDLFAENLLITPTTVVAGERVSYSASIVNLGSTASGTFDVHVVLSDDALLDGSDTIVATQTGIPAISSQAAVTINGKALIPNNQSGGVYQIGLIVDPADTEFELNEFNNNTALETLQVVAACTPDNLEGTSDNNAPGRASALGNGNTNATICPGDQDWFSMTLGAGEQVTVDVSFTHADGDLDLFIYNAGLSLVAESSSLNDNESVTFTASAAGTYYALVKGFSSTTATAYSINR